MRFSCMVGLMVLLVSAIPSCSSPPTYRYACILADKEPAVLAQGNGKPSVCQDLFNPPAVYMGRDVEIPQTASLWGLLVVSHETNVVAIPLFTWKDQAGGQQFGSSGPSSTFAHQENNQAKFIASIAASIGETEE